MDEVSITNVFWFIENNDERGSQLKTEALVTGFLKKITVKINAVSF